MVNGEQVKEAMIQAGIERAVVYPCSLCSVEVAYVRKGETLYFDSSCGCASSPLELRRWSQAAAYINIQTKEKNRKAIALRFGLQL